MKRIWIAVGASVLLAAANSASAALISFTDWQGDVSSDYLLTIDDDTTDGRFTFNASVADGYNGAMLAIGFGTTGSVYNSSNLDVQPDTYTTAFDTLFCEPKPGCNWNGTGIDPFNVIVRFAAQGSGVSSVTFSIARLDGMTLNDFTIVGIRAQDTGPNANDSDKVYTSTRAVPEPGALALLGIGLLAMALLRRRRVVANGRLA